MSESIIANVSINRINRLRELAENQLTKGEVGELISIASQQFAEIESLRTELAEAKEPNMFWDADDTENTINDVESYPDYVGMDFQMGINLEVELECAKRLTNKFARWLWNENDKRFEFIGLFDEALQEVK